MKAVEIVIPPDKSISHRSIMLASVSEGVTRIKNLLMAEDIKRTIEAFKAMGVEILPLTFPSPLKGERVKGEGCVVYGVGMRGLKKPAKPLYLGNSGTTMRILPGILAGQDFETILKGDRSLSKRPMRRIIEPLSKMGVRIIPLTLPSPLKGERGILIHPLSHLWERVRVRGEIYPPLKIHGGKLKSISYKSKIASAQVKSCILLAGLYANGVTSVTEPVESRDHTERMLALFGSRVSCSRRAGLNLPYGCTKVSVRGPVKLKSPGTIEIPGDISSAAFFIVAGCILPGAKIVIKNVGLNPTRTGILDILKRMGADIKTQPVHLSGGEPAGDIIVKTSELRGVTISPEEVTRAIDEIPIIMVAACFAKGKTIISGIEELHVKETDRIKSMVTNLRKIGADIIPLTLTLSPFRGEGRVRGEGIIINGGRQLHCARVSSFGDHRTAMSMLIAGLRTKGRVIVTGLECINKSFPNFRTLLNKLN